MTDHRTLRERVEARLDRYAADFHTGGQESEAAMEAPADAPPATPRACSARTPEEVAIVDRNMHGELVCHDRHNLHCGYPKCMEPAAEPPAPPAQVLTAEHDAILGGEEYRDILRRQRDWYQERMVESNNTAALAIRERDDARAEVARLQEELKTDAQHIAWLNSEICRLVAEHKQADEAAEAEAQALRAGLTEALEHYGNLAYSELKPSPYYDREEAKITRLSALLSPAQEAP
jgi:hypothetical protein